MSVDLVRAFAPAETEPARNEAPANASEFPNVLDSTLASEAKGGADSGERRARGAEPGEKASEQGTPREDASQGRVEEDTRESRTDSGAEASSAENGRAEAEAGSGGSGQAAAEAGSGRSGQAVAEAGSEISEQAVIDATAEENAQAAVEAAGIAVSANVLVEQARESATLEAEEEVAGRRTDLESRAGAGAVLDRETVEAGGAEGQVSREIGDELLAAITQEDSAEAASEPVAAAARGVAQASAENSPETPVVTNAAESLREAPIDPREGSATAAVEMTEDERAASEERSGGDSDRPTQDNPRESLPEAHFERAAEGSSAPEVDPTLRASIATQEAAVRAPDAVAVDGATAIASPVAGVATEVTTTATPGTPTPPAASDAISVQTEWLLSRGGGTARLVLHPQELGEIAIRVTLRGDAVDVVMVAQEAAAKGIAEEQAERLSQAFVNRDLRMENFEVRRGDAADLPGSAGEQFAESDRERDGQSEEGGGARRGVNVGADADERARELAAMPRILTTTPETGVDLRI